jgi:tyrosine-protein kinase Etk/Wzc
MNMQPVNQEQGSRLRPEAENEVSVLDLMIVVARRKRAIISIPIIAAIITAGATLLLPDTYQANTTLMPPQQSQSGASAMLSQLGGVAGLAGLGSMKNSSDSYIGILQSRTVANRLIEKLSLKKVYATESQDKARQRLAASTAVKLGKDGLITIEVTDADKKLVAPLANAYVTELAQLTKVLAVSEAAQRRLFYERQLEQAKDNLAKAEASLKGGLETRGVISVDVESQSVIETVGRLRAQISAKEIELNSMSAFVTPSNPEYRRAEEQLSSLRSELGKLENGRGATRNPSDVAGGEPKSGFENIKLLRDVKYQQMLYEILAKQYEVARLEEAKDPSVIQVLDPAVEPERKSAPHRSLIVAVAAMIALVGAIGWAFAAEAYRKVVRTEAGAAQWRELKSNIGFKRANKK